MCSSFIVLTIVARAERKAAQPDGSAVTTLIKIWAPATVTCACLQNCKNFGGDSFIGKALRCRSQTKLMTNVHPVVLHAATIVDNENRQRRALTNEKITDLSGVANNYNVANAVLYAYGVDGGTGVTKGETIYTHVKYALKFKVSSIIFLQISVFLLMKC